MRKKLLASILTVCMLFTMLPTAAFAADEDNAEHAVLSDESAVVTTAPENEVPQGSGAETGTYVAQIGTVEYETLEAAVEAVKDETLTEIKLLDNAKGNGIVIQSGKNITFNLNGFTYEITGKTVGSTGTETNAFQLLKDSNITFKNGKITSSKAALLIQNYSNLTFEKMILEGGKDLVVSNNHGSTIIRDTEIKASESGSAFDVYSFDSYTGAAVTVEGDSVIKGDIQVGYTKGANTDNLKLQIQSGTVNGKITKSSAADDKFLESKISISGGTFSDIAGAVKYAENGATLKLLKNVELDTPIDVDKSITLDLNGHTITNAETYNADYLVAVKRGGNLTIDDTMSGGAITTTSENVYAGVKMTVKDDGETGDTATLTVKGGTIQGYYYGIAGNGTRHGTDITINGGTITTANTEGDNTAIYHPQDGKLTVTGGTITGNTGIEIRSGSLTVTGGIIKGGEGDPTSEGEASGTTTTNTGIAIAQHTTKKPIQVNITGGTVSGGAAVYESNPQKNEETDTNKVSVEIRDVTLTGDVKAEGFGSVSLNEVTVTGNVTKGESSTGSMAIVDSTITGNATGTDVTIVNSTVNGTLTNTTPEGAVALVGGKTYTDLQAAITAAKEGDMVTLLADVDTLEKLNGSNPDSGDNISLLSIDKNVTINGNGKTISITMPEGAVTRSQAIQIGTGSTVTLNGVKLNITGVNRDTDKGDAVDVYGILNITNKSVVVLNDLANGFVMQGGENAQVNVTGGSTVTANGVKGHFSNGGTWEIKDSKVDIANCGTHGLSVEKLTVDNATVTVDKAGYTGIYASEVELKNNANVSVTNSATSPDLANKDAYKGKGAVQLKGDSGKLTVKDSTLTLSNNGNGKTDGEQTIHVGASSVTIENSSVTGVIAQTAANKYMVIVKNGDVVVKQEIVSGEYTLPAAPVKSGYTFTGWSDGTNTYKAGAKVTITKDTTFVAQWRYIDQGGDSDGSYEPSGDYLVSVDKATGGKVTVNPGRADKGDTVTITVRPDKGYELDELTVTAKNGDTVKLTEKSNGKFTFKMPGSKVTVEAVFVKENGEQPVVTLPFADVNKGDWFYDAVEYVYGNDLMNGTSATAFSPYLTTSRAMMLTMLARYDGVDTTTGSTWYEAGAVWAVAEGISDGTNLEADLTREQLVTMLWRYTGSPVVESDLSAYPDGGAVSDWAVNAMIWATQTGVITGNGAGALAPQGTATRAEVATILARFCAGK